MDFPGICKSVCLCTLMVFSLAVPFLEQDQPLRAEGEERRGPVWEFRRQVGA